jgi:hypothetical protein
MSKHKKFTDPPNRSKKKAVLNWSNSTYSPMGFVDGEQPYYTYQGIGSLKGQSTSTITRG